MNCRDLSRGEENATIKQLKSRRETTQIEQPNNLGFRNFRNKWNVEGTEYLLYIILLLGSDIYRNPILYERLGSDLVTNPILNF